MDSCIYGPNVDDPSFFHTLFPSDNSDAKWPGSVQWSEEQAASTHSHLDFTWQLHTHGYHRYHCSVSRHRKQSHHQLGGGDLIHHYLKNKIKIIANNKQN